ncbi:MAG TPA: AMP-binding protein, partial [Spirochaetota bacterium]|nr:AMP-binding protein [Spirochaetota bacterium]
EVHVRSPYVMLGYWNDPQATAAALKPGGWLAMGDVARIEDGLLYINARARDLLLVSAENVSPTEVEHCLDAHPKVLEACAIGVPHATRGESIKAFVVLKPGETATEDEIIGFCKNKLAPYKLPTEVEFRDDLPKSTVGKILRKELRAEELEQRKKEKAS